MNFIKDMKNHINKVGILTTDLKMETEEYLKYNNCFEWESRLNEKMKLINQISEENFMLNKERKLLKELYNVTTNQGQKEGKCKK